MAFRERGTDGTLNGTTKVEIVPAPTTGVRRLVRTIAITNVDTAPVTLRLALRTMVGATETFRRLPAGKPIPVDGGYLFDNLLVLDTVDESVVAWLTDAPATTNPDFVTAYADRSGG